MATHSLAAGAGGASGAPPMSRNVNALLKTITDVQVSKNAKETMALASHVFCMYVSNVATEFCREERRDTVTPTDILRALQETDFDHFVGELQAAQHDRREGHRPDLH